MRTILFINWYEEKNPKRAKELFTCLQKNIANTEIDFIVNISSTPINQKGVIDAPYKDRLTFSDFFHCINKTIKEDDISIIANLDIFFDDTLLLAKAIKKNQCYALSRWEINPDGSRGEKQIQTRGDSQDVWIFKGHIKGIEGDFPLGKLGCDNRIAYEIKEAGYEVLNPSRTIKPWHLHNSGVRNYSTIHRDKVSPPYHRIIPHPLYA